MLIIEPCLAMVHGLSGEIMIYPEFDKFTIENLQQQLVVLHAQIAQEKQIYTNILSPDFKPAKEYGEEVRINHMRTSNGRMFHYTTKRNKIQFEIQSRCEAEGIEPPPYNL